MAAPAPRLLEPQALRRALLALVATLATLGLAAELGYALAGEEDPYGLVAFAGLSYEQNLPTWAASALLLGCAGLLWLIGRGIAPGAGRWRRHWLGLAAVFACLSLDEVAEIHEQWGWLDAGDGLLYYSWVIPGAALVLALGVIYLPWLLALPAATRRRCVWAALLYLGGVLGMELPLGYWTARHGADNLGYGLIDWLVETLELAGASVFLYALALHLLAEGALVFRLQPGPQQGAPPARAPGTGSPRPGP